jgi:hypothetical protein
MFYLPKKLKEHSLVNTKSIIFNLEKLDLCMCHKDGPNSRMKGVYAIWTIYACFPQGRMLLHAYTEVGLHCMAHIS